MKKYRNLLFFNYYSDKQHDSDIHTAIPIVTDIENINGIHNTYGSILPYSKPMEINKNRHALNNSICLSLVFLKIRLKI